MSLLGHNSLVQLVEDGTILKSSREAVNSSSISLHLDSRLLREDPSMDANSLWRSQLSDPLPLPHMPFDLLRDGAYNLYPGELILASSIEVFNLPRSFALSFAPSEDAVRLGLAVTANWIEAGFNASVLTVSIKNQTRNAEVQLQYRDIFGTVSIFVHEPVPLEASYAARGKYNGLATTTGAKKAAQSNRESFNTLALTPIQLEAIAGSSGNWDTIKALTTTTLTALTPIDKISADLGVDAQPMSPVDPRFYRPKTETNGDHS